MRGEDALAFRLVGRVPQKNRLGYNGHPLGLFAQSGLNRAQSILSLISKRPTSLRGEHQQEARGIAQIHQREIRPPGSPSNVSCRNNVRWRLHIWQNARARPLDCPLALTRTRCTRKHTNLLSVASSWPLSMKFSRR
jgi:hypothetical protein